MYSVGVDCMNVNSTVAFQPSLYGKTHKLNVNPDSEVVNSFITPKSTNTTQEQIVNLKQEQKDSNNVWEDLSKDYDVRNTTFDKICDITLKLYEAGEISFKDHATLTFDWNRGVEYFRQNLQIPVKSDLNLTPANSEGKRDWIAEYEERAKQDWKFGNILGYHSNQKALSILKRLNVQ